MHAAQPKIIIKIKFQILGRYKFMFVLNNVVRYASKMEC